MTITATAQGGRKSSDWGSGGGGESSVDTTVTTSLFYIVSNYTRDSELTNEVAEGRVNPQVSKHILRVGLFGFYVNDIFQILSGDFAAWRQLLEDEIIVHHDTARTECLHLNPFKGIGEGRLEIQSLQLK